jgi:two-component system, cell cycle response regulator DivK
VATVTILIVDEREDRRLGQRIKLENAGHRVLEAASAWEAVYMASEHVPDLVFVDAGLPVINGWEAARRLKSLAVTRHIPVIAIDHGAQDPIPPADRSHAFDALLAGPNPPERILGEVARWIR